MKQKNKYRYFYSPHSNQLIRFEGESKGYWFTEGNFTLLPPSCFVVEDANPDGCIKHFQEVTLLQGLHYMKGNYVE